MLLSTFACAEKLTGCHHDARKLREQDSVARDSALASLHDHACNRSSLLSMAGLELQQHKAYFVGMQPSRSRWTRVEQI